ncbi:hypothetical protein CWE12_01225 [Aliidiomarina sedimenti]|uniref:Uncharacterized protein n=1 Tax=Aliidiomarina sedimenti TaxID=1933879 RepID=A0ABY0C1F3_9GAMM|nr:hypothetical protein [Aliidiomarina sedimenti]RUO31649.1 hypothetical protein CWE12_01225 [Aliidiomarina sedimenti]
MRGVFGNPDAFEVLPYSRAAHDKKDFGFKHLIKHGVTLYQDEFGKDLRRIQYGQAPEITIEDLNGIDRQAMKLAEQRLRSLKVEL